MRSKSLSLLAAVLLVAACNTPDEEVATVTGVGVTPAPGFSTDGSQVAAGTAVPGSMQDFQVNAGDRVFFSLDRADLAPEAQNTLNRQAQWLQQYQNVSVTIEGHADERGTREYNLALGDRRANAVRNYLIARGITPNRINTISYGKERPAIAGSSEQAWAQNRRGVTVLN